MRASSGRVHLSFMRRSKLPTSSGAAADEFQGEEFLMCYLGEFVLVESFREK